jgi:hypothetical protein
MIFQWQRLGVISAGGGVGVLVLKLMEDGR